MSGRKEGAEAVSKSHKQSAGVGRWMKKLNDAPNEEAMNEQKPETPMRDVLHDLKRAVSCGQCECCSAWRKTAEEAERTIAQLNERLTKAEYDAKYWREEWERHTEKEALVCPEDVGAVEYIGWLTRDLRAVTEKNAELTKEVQAALIREQEATHDFHAVNHANAELIAFVKRVRNAEGNDEALARLVYDATDLLAKHGKERG
jgi:uncharacterized protein YhaN